MICGGFRMRSLRNRKWIKAALLAIALILLLTAAVICTIRWRGKRQLTNDTSTIVGDVEGTVPYQGKDYQVREDVINILCLGVDREEDMMFDYGDGTSVGQADAIFVASIDLKDDRMRIIAVPRDTMVSLQIYNKLGFYSGRVNGQITLQYAYADGGDMSCYLMKRRVSELLCNIPIHGVAAVNLSCIPVINDAVGGVCVTMDEDYTWINPAFEQGAELRLWGEDARDFIQRRDTSVAGSAFTRISREKQYLEAFIAQAKQAVKRDVGLPFELMEELKNNMVTDLSAEEVFFLVSEAAFCEFSTEDIYVLPGEIRMGELYEEYYVDTDAVTQNVVELLCE